MIDINLGCRYRDKVTKFEGIAVGVTSWLTGCDSVGLQMEADEKGAVPDLKWFDVTRVVEIVDAPQPMEVKAKVSVDRPGGPQPTPTRRMEGC